jgi:hypothetical protein
MNGGAGWVSTNVLEFKPLIYFYRDLHFHWVLYYWIMLGVLAALLIAKYIIRKKFDLPEFLAVSFINVFANFYARGLMFSLLISSFYMAKSLHELWQAGENVRVPAPATPKKIKWIAAVMVGALLVSNALFIREIASKFGWALKPGVSDDWVTPWYPSKAVAFMKENRLQPPMYNYYTWGGFLIFKAYPDYKVFVDGRALDDDLMLIADRILKASPEWKQALDTYGINFILVPLIYRESGDIVPLVESLVKDPDWELVFMDFNSALYVRNAPQNRAVISRYRMDKNDVNRKIVEIEDNLLQLDPANPIYKTAKGLALFEIGRVDEATKLFNSLPPRYQYSGGSIPPRSGSRN